MPLPAALAAKLQKRGLITPKTKPELAKKQDFKGFSLCPNKWNVYHECNSWCEIHWKGFPAPDPKYARNIHKMMVKYPVPMNWTEIFDKGSGRYYYWNMENDLVSWLPPKHPKSVKCQSAARLRENRLKMREREERLEREKESERYRRDEKDKDKDRERDRDRDRDRERDKDRDRDRESDDEDRSHRSRRDRDRERERDERRSRHRRDERDRGNKKSRKDDIDPMDPAAYSDIPVGTWSDGLETNKKVADNTASGVLYQQRPYPAPGEVLAANKEKAKK